jgi:hypothetical protein
MQGHLTSCSGAGFVGDCRARTVVLGHVLEMHPLHLRHGDLVRELALSDDPESRDRIERAEDDLVKAGLLHRQGELVLPTPAAALFYELDL